MEFENEAAEAINRDESVTEQDEAAVEQTESAAEQTESTTEQAEATNEQAEAANEQSDAGAVTEQDEATTEQDDEVEEEQDEDALLNEAKLKIAEKVRGDSKDLHKLVAVETLAGLMPENQIESASAVIAEMTESGEYPDLQSIIAPNGKTFLYSDKYMSAQYATMLSRVEADNKGTPIAMTVRDDSKAYHRVTHIEFFQAKLFNIAPEEFDSTIAQMLEQEEFKDIKLLVASTGARFLYSDLYIDDFYAKNLAEWEEVGQYENP